MHDHAPIERHEFLRTTAGAALAVGSAAGLPNDAPARGGRHPTPGLPRRRRHVRPRRTLPLFELLGPQADGEPTQPSMSSPARDYERGAA